MDFVFANDRLADAVFAVSCLTPLFLSIKYFSSSNVDIKILSRCVVGMHLIVLFIGVLSFEDDTRHPLFSTKSFTFGKYSAEARFSPDRTINLSKCKVVMPGILARQFLSTQKGYDECRICS